MNKNNSKKKIYAPIEVEVINLDESIHLDIIGGSQDGDNIINFSEVELLAT